MVLLEKVGGRGGPNNNRVKNKRKKETGDKHTITIFNSKINSFGSVGKRILKITQKNWNKAEHIQLLLITLASLHSVEIDHNIWFEAPLYAWKHTIGRLSNPLQLYSGFVHL